MLGPSVNRQMRLRQQQNTGHARRLVVRWTKLMQLTMKDHGIGRRCSFAQSGCYPIKIGQMFGVHAPKVSQNMGALRRECSLTECAVHQSLLVTRAAGTTPRAAAAKSTTAPIATTTARAVVVCAPTVRKTRCNGDHHGGINNVQKFHVLVRG
jgi:hypothetical protein